MSRLKKTFQRVLNSIYYAMLRAHRAEGRDAAMRRGLLTVGEHTYGQPEVVYYFGQNGTVTVGRYCSIARGVKILAGGMHHPEWVATFPVRARMKLPGMYEDGQPFTKGNVWIGSDVWLGEDVTILSGVRIGHGAIIATGSLVNKDVADYEIVGGMPAKPLGKRFTDDQIEALLRIAWWHWEAERVIEEVELLSSPEIDAFIAKFDPHVERQAAA